jgi:ATP-binding cassette subfamily F protein uup
MGGPNVLVLDEPTNDFDTETLTALEDLLDGFAGTLLVISHDRYFLERVCDTFVAVTGDGTLTDLPRGVDQYLEIIRARSGSSATPTTAAAKPAVAAAPSKTDAALDRQRRKDLARLERQLEKAHTEEAALLADLETHSTDYEKVATLSEALRGVQARLGVLEEEWLLVSE